MAERMYYAQNWRGDVVLTLINGIPIERVAYSVYGVPQLMSSADHNHEGAVDFFDFLEKPI
ncbi:MAG: hypothetical protein SFZ23_05815 [Planctomycetota bacterium]|nr:hypothetical protein [Planctomycetota bacterium]